MQKKYQWGKVFLVTVLCAVISVVRAQQMEVKSPDGQLKLNVRLLDGNPVYTVSYKERRMLDESPLGLKTNAGDFRSGMKLLKSEAGQIDKRYSQDRIKKSEIHYLANTLSCVFENQRQQSFKVVFQVSNNDIAFRYELPMMGEVASCVVEQESTGFKFPDQTRTFLSRMMNPMTGFARTAPSYESSYEPDAPMKRSHLNENGYVFPGLFRIGNDGWVLLSETGVNSQYCASHLSELSEDGVYHIEFPDLRQNNGFGSTGAAISLPGLTPWRTITVGDGLKPIVETTIPFDVVEPLYEPSTDYKFGKSTWSWILWQDNSMNYEDQVTFIDLAADLQYEYILIDALWDKNIGKERMKDLISYAQSRNVDVFLWYNSNGAFNDAPQGPKNKMNTSIERKKEMKWLRELGVKGLKVDFFGGDKQETMRLYEDILSDANDYGLMIIFHGATLPRGWERMYPNFVGSEAVLASEMLVFSPQVREAEAVNATLHPFIRNAVASMEFGGVILNDYLNKSNTGKGKRLTTDIFQLATAVLFQNPLQMFALTPNNLKDAPDFEIEFMKEVPTTWDETIFIEGYPGKYVVLARRHKDQWYVVGVNAQKETVHLNIQLPMLAGKDVIFYGDDEKGDPFRKPLKIKNSGKLAVNIQPKGGVMIK